MSWFAARNFSFRERSIRSVTTNNKTVMKNTVGHSRLLSILTLLSILFTSGLPASAQNRCFICNSQKNLRSVKVDRQTRYLCQDCREEKSACEVCRRQGAGELQPDGRRICPSCARNLILTQAQLEDLYSGVKAFLKKDQTGVVVDFDLPVKLADPDEFNTKANEGGRAVRAVGFYSAYNPEQIYMLSGRDRVETASTLAHEYTHAWQSRNCPSQDRALKEGFACYVEYRYLISIGERARAQGITRISDPDYGEALSRLLEYEKKVGVDGVVKWATTERNLPKP